MIHFVLVAFATLIGSFVFFFVLALPGAPILIRELLKERREKRKRTRDREARRLKAENAWRLRPRVSSNVFD